MLGLVALLAPAYAADVLLVEATPAAVDDFSVAGLFYSMVVSAAEERGLDYEDADAIRKWAGADADTCWDVEACPANLWDRTGARLAVVMVVGASGNGLEVGVRLHGVDETAPFKVFKEQVAPGQEAAVAAKIARAAADALPLLPVREPMGGPVLVIEDEVILAPDEPREPPDEPEEPREPRDERTADTTRQRDREPVDTKPDREPRDTKPDREPRDRREPRAEDLVRERFGTDEERRAMGVPAWAFDRYRTSGLSKEAWLAKARVRAGHAFLELGGGWSMGDVDRGYGVRLRLQADGDDFEAVGTSTWEGVGAGAAPNVGVTLGYAPAWYLDTSVAVSVQYGAKHLDTGWECPDRCTKPAEEYEHEAVSAVQAFIEPRLRLYPVATGVVKPYALVAFSVLVHDGFEVPDLSFVDYPDSPGGASFGPTAGLGLAIDAVSRVSFYGEVPATLLLSQPETRKEGSVDLDPGTLVSAGYVVRFVGGIAVRL